MAIDRYHRQTLLPQIGNAGQARLADARVLVVGCGALGCTIADQLARAGVGFLRIVDRDIVELTNLQRQTLYEESDVVEAAPKAVAAARRLAKINSNIAIEHRIADVSPGNVESLLQGGIDLILDGTDNVATRYLLNDVSVKHGVRWIYGACVGVEGRVMTILPGAGPCLRCVFPNPPDPAELATCDTAGVLGPAIGIVSSLQATAAIKLIVDPPSTPGELTIADVWSNRFHSIDLADSRRDDCPCCARRGFQFLDFRDHSDGAKLCGRSAVQICAAFAVDLPTLATRLRIAGDVKAWPYMIRCTLHESGLSMSAFEDGRVIIQGTSDIGRARAIVAKFIGS